VKPTDAHPGRVFAWNDPWHDGAYVTVYVTLERWTSNPGAHLNVLILETTYPHHTAGHVMTLHPNDTLWKGAKRIA
jgi:hypothetical protein